MVKHSYIILPPPGTGDRQTVVSIAIHGDAPTPQDFRKTKKKNG